MARDEDKRWQCDDCGAITLGAELLRAKNPFDETDTIIGCPNCKSVSGFIEICDEPGCTNEATCGFPVDDAFGFYRRTCLEHWMIAEKRQVDGQQSTGTDQ